MDIEGNTVSADGARDSASKIAIRKETFLSWEADDPAREDCPIITTGSDVSHYLVDLRDDGGTALTFRSIFIGIVFGCLGASIRTITVFKPTPIDAPSLFLLLIICASGLAWSKLLPQRSSVEGTRFTVLAPVLGFLNTGEFRIKEHVIATFIALTASSGNVMAQTFAVQRIYYNTQVDVATAILVTFSTTFFGYGLCGLLRSLTVYPSEMVYWANLNMVTLFQSLHFGTRSHRKRMRLFWFAFVGMFIWEMFPSYIFPLLSSINIFCLASQHASESIQNVFTNIFGTAGLGLLNVSLDWESITLAPMTFPLIPQLNIWVGCALSYAVVSAFYYCNVWNLRNFPILSTEIFYPNGSIYNLSAVFGNTYQLNETALEEVGLPHLASSNVWYNISNSLAIGGLLAHSLLIWGPYLRDAVRDVHAVTHADPHWKAMQRYKEVSFWWHLCLLSLSLVSGLLVIIFGKTNLSWYAYLVALLLGSFMTPIFQLIYAHTGISIPTSFLTSMVGGMITDGHPVSNLYFAGWSNNIIGQSLTYAGNFKIAQFTKVPPQAAFFAQLLGSSIVVSASIVSSHDNILKSNNGTDIWSGQALQGLNDQAMIGSLTKVLYGPEGPYAFVLVGLLIGTALTTLQWLFTKWPGVGLVNLNNIIFPIIFVSFPPPGTISCIVIGTISQFWLRKYHPVWFRKYNYILGGALDGGAKCMIFILSASVFGAFGAPIPFPNWIGNPANGNYDYCNGNT
ncbi:OPT oligopeptide transporter protein-domain-containing protein [Scleroderma citrinum]